MSLFVPDASIQYPPYAISIPTSLDAHPSSNVSINILRGRKRPREADTADVNEPEPLLLQSYPLSYLDRPTKAWPQLLLPRTGLPLSFLEPRTNASPVFRTRFVTSNIGLLDAQKDRQNQTNAIVLIAKLEIETYFCAIERVETGLYSICKLASCINLEKLQALSKAFHYAPTARTSKVDTESKEWWCAASIVDKPPQSIHTISWETGPVESDGLPPPLSVAPMNPTSIQTGVTEIPFINQRNGDGLDVLDLTEPVQVLEEVYTNIVNQYLNNLYLTKSSLAYFAKGSLTRARVACSAISQHSTGQLSLPDFLRSLVLGISVLDRKYKEGIPLVVKAMPPDFQNETNSAEPNSVRVSGRGLQKSRAGKDGLYPSEKDNIKKWWTLNDTDIASELPTESCLAIRLTKLKFRETLLQLILILEVLALEQAITHPDSTTCKTHSRLVEDVTDGNTKSIKKPKSRRRVDMNSMIDSLIDKLSIWQSVESFNDVIEKDTGIDTSAQAMKEYKTMPLKVMNSDQLKDFYMEIVIPFYGARLPDLVSKLAEDFGVSAGRSSPDQKLARSTRQRRPLLPGSNFVTTQHKSSHKSSSRDTPGKAAHATHPPSLTRCATDSSIHGIKREKSATPRLSFDYRDERKPLSKSISVLQSKMLSQREIDFGFVSKLNELRARKKTNVEEELQEAIFTMKKPNRSMAVKEFVDATDSRNLKYRSNRTNNTAQKRPELGVQVIATPQRLNKTKSITSATARLISNHGMVEIDEDISCPNPNIPSSAICLHKEFGKRGKSGQLPVSETPSRGDRRFSRIVEETGARQALFAKPPTSSADGQIMGLKFKMPGDKSASATYVLPVVPYDGVEGALITPVREKAENQLFPGNDLVETPIRRLGFVTAPVTPNLQNQMATATTNVTTSVYDALGWDDDDDERYALK